MATPPCRHDNSSTLIGQRQPDAGAYTARRSRRAEIGDGAGSYKVQALWHDAPCALISTKFAAGSAKAAPTPGSPTSSKPRFSRSRPSRRTTTLRPPNRIPVRPPARTSTTRSTCAPRTTRSSPPSSRRPKRAAPRRRRPAWPRRPRRPSARPRPASDDDEDAKPAPRRRGRRGGRGRARVATGPLEGTFDHGEEGYGLWLDPAVTDNPVYAEHWAGPPPGRGHRRRGPDRDPARRIGRRGQLDDGYASVRRPPAKSRASRR